MSNSGVDVKPIAIGPDVTLNDAIDVMRTWGMRHLPVTDNEDRPIGILSERDAFHHLAFHAPQGATVRDAMSSKPYIVAPDAPLAEVTAMMARHKYGCALVTEEGKLTGILTTVNILKLVTQMLTTTEPAITVRVALTNTLG